jgi:serine-type D-Ala-D-Ala carboxypeptidase
VTIDAILDRALEKRFTGAVARVEVGGELLYERAVGTTRLDERMQPVYVDTRFDLASLTKLFITTVALDAAEHGCIDLDAPVAPYLPQWRDDGHAGITPRMLLAHTSGMDSGADYRRLFAENVGDFALGAPMLAAPGERVIYSDLGMIALGLVLERATGRSLPALCADRFGFHVGFNPPAREIASIPATEEDAWRGRVQGRVHDEKAALMHGVAGHAGLFGTAYDVARMTDRYLHPQSPLFKEAVRLQADHGVLRRGLGWALKTSDANSCGARFSMHSFGHTGFTGTCVWADPDRDLQAVLLTNTVYFGREDSRELRAAFYDAAIATFAA